MNSRLLGSDDAIFGGTTTPTPPPIDDKTIAGTLGDEDKKLAIGGRFYLRANAYLPEDPSAKTTTIDSPNLLDLSIDARPNDLVRGYAQARLVHDPTVTDGEISRYGTPMKADQVVLDQLFLNLDVHHLVYVTAGQQRIKWGAGRFWNPTDFLDPARLDPLAFFDERTGVPLLKVHFPYKKLNLYAIADFDQVQNARQVQGAFRAELLVGLTEFAVTTAVRKGDPLRLGGQVTTGIGPVDLKGEVAVLHGVKTPHWEGDFDWSTFTFPTKDSVEDDWIVQAVGGAEVGIKYNDQDAVYLGIEYFYNGLGYDDANLYPWLLYQGQFEPFYLGRQYGGLYVYLPAPFRARDWTFTASTLGNLSDQSYVGRLDVAVQALTKVRLNAYGQYHFGDPGEFKFSLEVPAIPGVFDNGLSVPSPLVDVGVGAQVEF